MVTTLASSRTELEERIARYEAGIARLPPREFPAIDELVGTLRTVVAADGNGADGIHEEDQALLARGLCVKARAELIVGRHDVGKIVADESVAIYDGLDESILQPLAGPCSEALRVAGNARLKLGAVAAALPLLERAIRIAERGLDQDKIAPMPISAASALIRGLNNLGFCFLGMGEIDGAIETLERAIAINDEHPSAMQDRPDDLLLIVGNLADALQQRARGHRVNENDLGARRDLDRVRALLEQRAWPLIDRPGPGRPQPTAYGEQEYWGRLGHTLLLEDRPHEALVQFRRQYSLGGDEVTIRASAAAGIAEAELALGHPEAALQQARAALASFDVNEEIVERAPVLLVVSRACKALGRHEEALAALEEHHRLRSKLDATVAHQYASHIAVRIGLERARAEIETQRRLADELQSLNDKLSDQAGALVAQAVALSEARLAAEAASRAKSAFLANMSHELRTPLNAILGFSEMLRDGMAGTPGPAWAGYAAHVHDAGSHLLAVINDVLDLSKVEAGRMEIDDEILEIARLFQDCRKLVAARARQQGLRLAMVKHPTTPYVVADPTRLKQILLNLLSNAIKFTPCGGRVTLSVRRTAQGDIEFVVRDTGCGMSPDEIQRALEVFGQADSGLARKHEGTGLGLPLAVRLTQLHGGQLTIDSHKGVGTTVRVRLPGSRIPDMSALG